MLDSQIMTETYLQWSYMEATQTQSVPHSQLH